MKAIKYRQPYFNRDGTFSHWHYWGWMSKGEFIGPLSMGHPVNDEFGLMFISQYDKNGKEIYEGDVVKFSNNSSDPENYIAGAIIIKWDIESAKFVGDEMGYDSLALDEYMYVRDGFEVIGNIYESPELLE